MIYIDSSVALAYLLAESRAPSASFWDAATASSRLLEYEVWNRLCARRPYRSRDREARALLAGVQLVDMSEPVLARALMPFPVATRTLDALHLATADFLRGKGETVELASYDNRLIAAAQAIGIAIATL